MTIDDLIKQVNNISATTNYWFIRTDGGEYFDTFVQNNFIAIGWNDITLDDLVNGTPVSVKQKIEKLENIERKRRNTFAKDVSKGDVTTIYNKLKHFINLQSGDIVIIPSANSSRLAFGYVTNNETIIVTDDSDDCNYFKRRSITWLNVKNLSELDAMFYKIKVSRHTISKIDPQYYSFIDNVLNTVYTRDNNTHFVIDVRKTGDINVRDLIDLVNNLQKLCEEINDFYNFGENIESSSIRLNLQSPGLVEFKVAVGKTLIILTTVLSLTCCNVNNAQLPQVEARTEEFIHRNQDTIRRVDDVMTRLDVAKDRIYSLNHGTK